MPTTDPGEKRMYANQVKRHEEKLQALAEHIHEYAGYLLREVQEGRPSLSESHANTIASDVANALRRIAALDALADVAFVFADGAQDD